jgi:hypothetical protein
MRTSCAQFKDIVDTIYELPLDERLELKNLLELNIAEARREGIALNYKKSQKELESGILEFSSNLNDLKKKDTTIYLTMKKIVLFLSLILTGYNCYSQPSKIYIKDKSQYDPIFIKGLKLEPGDESIKVIDDSLFCTYRPKNKPDSLVTHRYSIPTNLTLNKEIIFSTICDNVAHTLVLKRTNYTNIGYRLMQEEKTIISGVAILQSTFYFGAEGQDDGNGKPIYLRQYIDPKKCGAIIQVEIEQAKIANITWCTDENSDKWISLPNFSRR